MTAALQSILIGVQERRLRSPQTGLLGVLPPMESMENLFISVLWLGLGLLTLSIATGMLFLQDMFDQRLVHHTVLTTLSCWFMPVFSQDITSLAGAESPAFDGIWLHSRCCSWVTWAANSLSNICFEA
jgi:hypothetical protein